MTTADTSIAADVGTRLLQRFEGQDLQGFKKGSSDALQFTLSFHVKSPKTGTHCIELLDIDNNRSVSATYTVSQADTWQYVTHTFPADTTGAFADDNGQSFIVVWWLAAGSNFTSGSLATTWGTRVEANRAVGQVNVLDNTANNFYITGCQLEVGDTATSFEHRSYGEELMRCMRYYETNNHTTYAKNTDGSITSYWSTITSNDSNTLVVSTGIVYKVPKRASPTVTLYNSSNTGTANRVNAQGTERTVTSTYGGPNALTRIYVSGASSGNYVTYNWEASSEL